MQKLAHFAATLLFIVVGSCGSAQTKTQPEDIRVNLTRVMIEKARNVGRNNPVGKLNDGFDAVREMVYRPIKLGMAQEDRELEALRLYHVTDFAQGWAELERNPAMAGKTIKYDISMGTKEKGNADFVIVRFLYPDGVLPEGSLFNGFEWQLSWKQTSKSPNVEAWQLETASRTPISAPAGYGRSISALQ